MVNNGVIVVSHSHKIGEGVTDLINEMIENKGGIKVINASGTLDGRIGTSVDKILDAIDECNDCDNVLLFYDIGSAKMSSEIALEMANHENVKLMEYPIVEGAFIASITFSVTSDINTVINELESYKEEL